VVEEENGLFGANVIEELQRCIHVLLFNILVFSISFIVCVFVLLVLLLCTFFVLCIYYISFFLLSCELYSLCFYIEINRTVFISFTCLYAY
jgi:hypothetical protein